MRGAIDQLAMGRAVHWRDHFAVRDPDGKTYAVPWEWTQPPFQLVQREMDVMDDFGTRACRAYADIGGLRDHAQKLEWLGRQEEVHIQRSFLGWKETPGFTIRWKSASRLAHSWDTRRVEAFDLCGAIAAAEAREAEIADSRK